MAGVFVVLGRAVTGPVIPVRLRIVADLVGGRIVRVCRMEVV
jgi:hypothetical protein